MFRSVSTRPPIGRSLLALAFASLASACSMFDAKPEVPPTVSPSISAAAVGVSSMRKEGVEYPLYTIHLEITAPLPDGGTYTRAQSEFSGFLGQNVKWISARTDALPNQDKDRPESVKGATTGMFACVRFLRGASDSDDAVRIGIDYSYASLPPAGMQTASTVVRKSASLPDLMVLIGKPSYLDLGNGSRLIMQASRSMVGRDEAIDGMNAMKRRREAIPIATRRGIQQSEDGLVRALTGRSRSCP